ncbi:Protein of unknown function [Cribrihabitans marinus]|uniref:ATP-dependent transcriptional regulator n=1 Tax=Cribrihabitans marinus TaxID=1227549 RepID=A0A1H6QTC3_9RHOB|nr:DUF2927 domain-containing protein [Cribrihabitans marinus]GGH19822.1 hypothetical protein GCM10010973_03370 [Cribrihabitans marinus]SEI46951.1 Protein of unknown function [Cribrihabitans marinus]
MRRAASLALALILAGCSAQPLRDTPTRANIADSTLPPMKTFAAPRPSAPVRSNGNIAADFLSLHFELESGRQLPVFTRFETPITVRVTGQAPPSLGADLSRLLGRLRGEAGIDIRQVSGGMANITIEAVSRDDIRRALPQAACFVVPNVSSLEEFRRERRSQRTNWSLLRDRNRLGIFVPADSSPQEVRDCLHEELAQAIGPLNDLYRLPDSVFNDDNVHTVLTGFDMLILRATYAPELRSGMTRAQVAAALPGILARLNPAGAQVAPEPASATPRNWIDAVQTALGPGASASERRAAANEALITARRQGWTDHRRAFSHYIAGRMLQMTDPEAAQQEYGTALHFLAQTPGTELQRAYVITQTAAYAIASGDGATALRQIRPQLAVAERAENAALLSTLMLLQAEALDLTGRHDRARAVRLDSLGWARYGFGSDWAVRSKMQEVASLNPRKRLGG